MIDMLPMTEYKTKKQRDREYLSGCEPQVTLRMPIGQAGYLASDQGPDGHTEIAARWADQLASEHAMDNFESTTYYRHRKDKP